MSVTAEGGGFVATCACDWTRFYATHAAANVGEHDHAKKCKGPKVKREAAPQRAHGRNVKWDDREGATWIDSL